MTKLDTTTKQDVDLNTDVLVIGAGFTGYKAAQEVSDWGYKVVLLEQTAGAESKQALCPGLVPDLDAEEDEEVKSLFAKVSSSTNIELLSGSALRKVDGFPGGFSISLAQDGKELKKECGSILVATDLKTESLHEAYGLELSDQVWSQSQLEDILFTEGDSQSALQGRDDVVFLLGFGQEGNPVVLERAMRSIERLTEKNKVYPYIFVNNLKVAADGLEKLYKKCRDCGAVFFKLTEAPKLENAGQKLTFMDPIAREEVEITPDLLVMEEAFQADSSHEELAQKLRIDIGPWTFLQSDNVHNFPVRTNREGIYVLGSSRDVRNLSAAWTDVQNAALEVKRLLGQGQKQVPREKAVVDHEKCCFCLTCYRSCPHGAIYWEEKPLISPLACQACGICASECPQDAIQIGDFEDDSIKKQVQDVVQGAKGSKDPLIVAFCCQNSASEAAEMAKTFELPLPQGLNLIEVPCAGKIDLDYILSAYVEGVDGVMVMTCHQSNCKSERGNIFAGWRVDTAQRMLKETSFGEERLKMVTLASNMGHEFAKSAREMEEQLKASTPSPFK